MDDDRRIRFLVAPFFFLVSLVWGIAHDPEFSLAPLFSGAESSQLGESTRLVAAIAGGGLALFPLGYAIGGISYVLLRLAFEIAHKCRLGLGSHESYFPRELENVLWQALAMPGRPSGLDLFFAGVVFDHCILRDEYTGVHKWLFRRWSAFNIAVASTIALLLSLPFGKMLGIVWCTDWLWTVSILCVVLVLSAYFSWRDTMGMAAFMLRRHQQRNDSVVS